MEDGLIGKIQVKRFRSIIIAMSCISSRAPPGWGKRHTVAFLGFWAVALSYAVRFNLSFAIVAMVNDTRRMEVHDVGIHTPKNFSVSVRQFEETCVHLKDEPLSSDGRVATPNNLDGQGEFHWDSVDQGIILGSFYVGNVITLLPAGILATKYGGKWTLGIGLFISAIFAILTPILARTHVYLLIAARVIQGFGDGVTMPAMHVILAAWAPPDERSFLGSMVYAGSQVGTALAMITSGYLIHGGILGGWPSVFYVFGGSLIIWFVMWMLLMHDTPSTHPTITQHELWYIQNPVGKVEDETRQHEAMTAPPWLEIFKSVPMWAIGVAHIGHCYGLYTILTLLPTYLKTALHFDIKENSWLSAMPFIAMWLVAILTTKLADYLVSNKILQSITVRKLCHSIGHIGSAIALIGASYSGCDRALTVTLLTVAVGINGATYGGFVVNHIDIAPNYAGILMGITNTFANLTGFAAPYIAGLLINDDPSIQNWQYVFFIAAGMYFCDVLIYVLFSSSTEQPWNRPKEREHGVSMEEMKSVKWMQNGN